MECYYFGTFNPVHFGHIRIANEVMRVFNFDKIIFVPSYIPPHKNYITNPIDRLNMLKLIENEKIKISDIEYRLPTPSYSYQTIKELLKNTNGKVNFIIGYDAFIEIQNWKNPEFLKENVRFIVLKRKGQKRCDIEKLKLFGYDFVICDSIEKIDISSTRIREKIQKGDSIKGLADDNVIRYINENGLYRTNFKK